MKSLDALPRLAQLTASQWGMVTTAQAESAGVSRMQLSRLTQRGLLERLVHGVYRDAGSTPGEWDDIRAAWISAEPKRTAEERLRAATPDVVVSGSTAAHLHGYGDLQPEPYELITSKRRQSQRTDVRYRQRSVPPRDVTVVSGLPTTTIERTIADLVRDHHDLSLVADVLAGAVRADAVDTDRLVELLDADAGRTGEPPHDGAALVQKLLELGGVDAASQLERVLRQDTAVLADLGQRIGEGILASLAEHRAEMTGLLPDIAGSLGDAMGHSLLAAAVRESVLTSLLPSTSYITDGLLEHVRKSMTPVLPASQHVTVSPLGDALVPITSLLGEPKSTKPHKRTKRDSDA
ncbi:MULTISPECIES: type IV toxin-antitoxin system AbiEi family antitoxin domain-containing protein [Clavibacter]|uniref:Transcriptional regulator n=2 Tax=Clavibacter TaxID=1573 RepID=A0A399P2Y1_9MICO|nr:MULTISPECIES: type IV toxin-antitoxin system AbiEi family antitoxin domain-containing protein [Clavibacter]RII99126.1 transcriptional regulator [Clavibacter michiganensis]UKF26677.1 type IV toxin-antitoxin system AbiEi family antitoxin domain-containing protein [Clavibacter sp. A6099]